MAEADGENNYPQAEERPSGRLQDLVKGFSMKANVKIASELVKLARGLVAESDLEALQKLARREKHFGYGYEYKVRQVEQGKFQLLKKNGEPQELIGSRFVSPFSDARAPHGEWENVFDYGAVERYLSGGKPYGRSYQDLLYQTILNGTVKMGGSGYEIGERKISYWAKEYGFDEDEVRAVMAELVKNGEVVFDNGVWRRP